MCHEQLVKKLVSCKAQIHYKQGQTKPTYRDIGNDSMVNEIK